MAKRIISFILAFCMLTLTACEKERNSDDGKAQQKQLYEQAVAVLKEEELKLDGSNEVTQELLIALNNAEYTQPKSIILMIGDGMGFNIVEAAQRVYQDQLYDGTLAMNYMPFQGGQCTYSVSNDITDSAAGATALATGLKTMNGVIAMDYSASESYNTVLELAAEKGKSTGVVATKAVTDATPAAFTAHASSRKLQDEIASMQMEKTIDGSLDLILGGGRSYYESDINEEILAQAKSSGVTYANSWDEISEASLPVVGLFAETAIDTMDDVMPSVAEMTDLALTLLSDNEEGFFLMVEGSQIDTYGEKNEFDRETKELYDFDCAVAVAMRYVALNPDTVLIITADHETGDLWIPAEDEGEESDLYEYTTGSHTNKKVPVFAAGYGVEALSGIVENTDIAILMASYLGETQFGQKSTIYTVWDESKTVSFDEKNDELIISMGEMPELQENSQLAQVFHVTVENTGDTIVTLPVLNVTTSKKEYAIEAQVDYIEPGAILSVSYTLPYETRVYSKFAAIEEFSFQMDGTEAELKFSEMKLTARPFGR